MRPSSFEPLHRPCGGRRAENPRDQWIVVEGAHPAIVSEELFKAANSMRVRRGKQHVKTVEGHTYLLTGLVQCAICGGPIVSKRGANRHNPEKPFFYYVCRAAVREKKCDAPTIRCDDLDRAILEALRSQPLNEIEIQRIWKEIGDPLADPLLHALRDGISDMARRQKNLISNFEDEPSVPKAVLARYHELEQQIASTSQRLATLELSRTSQLPRNVSELKERLRTLAERLHSVDRKELRAAIHAFVAEISLDSKTRKAKVAYILPIRRSADKVCSLGNCGGWI